MKIDRKLNLVIPIDLEDGTTVYAHSMAIGREVFESHFLVISKTFSAIYSEGLGAIAGPRVAGLMLKKCATDLGVWDGETGVQNTLINEIHRLTNLLSPGERGWSVTPFQDAIDQHRLDPDDFAEVDNALVYFTVASSMHKKKDLAAVTDGALKLWGARASFLGCTEYANSLQTLTTVAPSGGKTAVSSVPS